MTHPLIAWLHLLLRTRATSSVPGKQLRARSELLLLARHETDEHGEVCRFDGEPWPCLEWRAIAAGWAHCPGYQADWTPERALAVVDLDRVTDPTEETVR